MAERLCI